MKYDFQAYRGYAFSSNHLFVSRMVPNKPKVHLSSSMVCINFLIALSRGSQ
jgi:hypothetical protein